jgi:hypothetical protein
MKHICQNCQKEYDGRVNKIYCSDKCRERQRFLRRKDTSQYKQGCSIREKRWYDKTGKYCKRKYQKRKKFRDYQNKWRRDKKYWLEQYDKHKDTNLKKASKYRKTKKGHINRLKSNEKRRRRNILLTEHPIDFLSEDELKIIDERDEVCVYCAEHFNEQNKSTYPTYDHIDFKKPLTLDNAVKCCWSCNSSKRNTPIEKILEWIKRKKFNPSPIVFELINKNKK